jgi:hypothetical protein
MAHLRDDGELSLFVSSRASIFRRVTTLECQEQELERLRARRNGARNPRKAALDFQDDYRLALNAPATQHIFLSRARQQRQAATLSNSQGGLGPERKKVQP